MNDTPDVAVIVGRFQVDDLHEGHVDFLNKIVDSHSKTIVFLGLSPIKCSKNNPLDFEARKQMIIAKFPDIIVLYIPDTYSNGKWSDNKGDVHTINSESELTFWFAGLLNHLKKELKFPYKAEIRLVSFSSAVSDGEIVKVTGVENWIDLYGVLMEVKKGRQTLEIPLEELIVVNKKSKNYRIIDAFLDWYGEAFA